MKQKITIDPPDKQQTLSQFFQYLELSGLLFDHERKEIWDVTDIPSDNKFHKIAKHTAKQLGIKWTNMSHEDSNRVMLAMLEDSFNMIRNIENNKHIIIKTTIQIMKQNE